MNRLRHAYLEMVPTLEPYFSTSPHDDLRSAVSIYGAPRTQASPLGSIAHGLTTAPGMVGTITAAVGGAFIAALTLLLGAIPMIAIIAGLAAFAILAVVVWLAALRQFRAIERTMEIRFPPPGSEQ
jgi:lysylphosphatidylglycerol synthetase-like protein (DUF2156 family)